MREGLPLPERIKNAPTLEIGLELFYTAFFELGTCRQLGMAEGPIPWTAIDIYCNSYTIVSEQREDMHMFIRSMDNAYLKYQESKRKKG